MRLQWLRNWWRDLWAEPTALVETVDNSEFIKSTLEGSTAKSGPIPQSFFERVRERLSLRREQLFHEIYEIEEQRDRLP